MTARSPEAAASRPVVPFGAWPSPISAADLTRGETPVQGACFVAGEVWWSELRPDEDGRYAVARHRDGERVDVLAAPWNARTRVHEYGGGAWTVTTDKALVFAEFSDQRVYRLDAESAEPVVLTPLPAVAAGLRYAELTVVGNEIWCIREHHAKASGPTRHIVAFPLDGSAAGDPDRVRVIAGGYHFLAYPRVSPDGSRLAWIAWNHPQMPWDGTVLCIAELVNGVADNPRVILGSPTESVLQPEWDGEELLFLSDRSSFWNVYRTPVQGTRNPELVYACQAEVGGPLWELGARFYACLTDGRLVVRRTFGDDTLVVVDTDGTARDIDLGDLTTLAVLDAHDDVVLLRTAGAQSVRAIQSLDLATSALTRHVSSSQHRVDAAYLPRARAMTFAGPKREVHAFVYEPRNPGVTPPSDELAPYVVFVHGGPTAHVTPVLSTLFAFFTSRGIGVVDVNYGGSTGYGRAYRERLRGQWGVVDVEDCETVVAGLADAGLADVDRIAIEGGSAGGWTVLAALTRPTSVFACGASFYGVAELTSFVADMHDFESRYLDGLIGPLPEARDLYDSRAPLSNMENLSCPVLLLQGLDDPIVLPSQAEMFRDALVDKGIPHAYLAFEGESHGFRRSATIIASCEAELSFYGQVMGFQTPGIPVLELWRPAAGA